MDGKNVFVNPFYRPWMTTYGAAASAGGSNKGMKGIIAGEPLNIIIGTNIVTNQILHNNINDYLL